MNLMACSFLDRPSPLLLQKLLDLTLLLLTEYPYQFPSTCQLGLVRLRSMTAEISLLRPPLNLVQPRQAQLQYPLFYAWDNRKVLEIGARRAEFRFSFTTSQLCDFGLVTASLSISFLIYKIQLIIIANIHYVPATVLSVLCIS